MRLFHATLGTALGLLLAGCCANSQTQVPPYYGPTETMPDVVRQINENNEEIRSIWSDHVYELRVHDRNGDEHNVHDNGVLLYRKPNEFLLQCKTIKGLLFEVGSSAGDDPQYWATMTEGDKAQYWGHYRNLGKPCVDMRKIPVRPDLLIEVLGVSDFNTNFLQPPVPVMKYNSDAGGFYMFTWNVRLPDHWSAMKEVWYDRVTKLPRKVLLFDENGRILVRADLSEHEPLEGGNKQIATRYELFFPDTGDQLTFKLIDPRVSKNGIPKPGVTIRRRDPGDDIRQVQIDEKCP